LGVDCISVYCQYHWWICLVDLVYNYCSAKINFFLFVFILQVSDLDSMSQHHNVISSAKEIVGATVLKQNQRQEGSGRIIRSILSKKELRQSQSSRALSEQQIQTSNLEKDKQSPRPIQVQLILKGMNGTPDNKIGVLDSHVFSERQERHIRHKDRPDRGVWTSCSNGADESFPSAAFSQVDPLEGTCFIL